MIVGLPTVVEGDAAAPLVVVMLHGYRMGPQDLAPFARSLGTPALWLFPEGPVAARPAGRAWWDIDEAAREAALAAGPRDLTGEIPPGLAAARARLGDYLDAVAGIAAGRPLVLGGFSQGGMLIADLMLRSPRPVAGLMLLSASRIACAQWPPLADRWRGLPVLVSHGRGDQDLAFAAGEGLRTAAESAGARVDWTPFDGGHEIPLPVWRRIRRFLAARGSGGQGSGTRDNGSSSHSSSDNESDGPSPATAPRS